MASDSKEESPTGANRLVSFQSGQFARNNSPEEHDLELQAALQRVKAHGTAVAAEVTD